MKNLITIVGARPQFVKAAVLSKALSEAGLIEEIVHTGQHYDHQMSTVFWEELGLPVPSVNLEVGSGRHGAQTGLIMQKLEKHILDGPDLPDAMIVYGDTNSTLAGALVASKLHIPIIHVEAGLRSFNRHMPEEVNRVLTDHISDLLFCSSEEGVNNLTNEGISEGVHVVGDVMYDAVKTFSSIAAKKDLREQLEQFIEDPFYLATIHRPSNTDNPKHLENIITSFSKMDKPVIWPVHPRNRGRMNELNIPDNLVLTDPVSYFMMLRLLKNCSKVITDSGGLQKEAYWLQKPCITVRSETEWTETLEGGWNILTGPDSGKIIEAVKRSPVTDWKPLYGNGKAAQQIAKKIKEHL